MADIEDSSITKTVEANLRLINDACTPYVNIDNIDIQNSYTYVIGDNERELVDVADYSSGDCQGVA